MSVDASSRKQLNEQMARLADGERAAFDPVYATMWPAVLSFCKRTLPNNDAEDAAQLALLKVFDRAATFDRERDALTWAITIAAWECRTLRKKRLRQRSVPLDEREHERTEAEGNPESLSTERGLMQAAQEVLGTLSEVDRQTLLATFDDEAPTDVPPATFRKRRERAVSRLREAWRLIYGS